ncbi:peroxidase 12-like [Phoenix dactylifera]|uniref:Peroxidase n=1 Tax=Phoenix dactylifera TaxID=42345 RepID=A0A8B7BMA2_PHODC|nr:peroxidase 12-like [Phoenix dactylifera]
MASSLILVLVSSLAFLSSTSEARTYPPIVKGLSFTFYESTCPHAESIIRQFLTTAFKKDIGLAAGLLRIHFHDCFVQGCDGSILLDGTASDPSEKGDLPNLTLRKTAFKAINDVKALLDRACGRVVSCADIAALAARDSVYLSGGPKYKVPLGRRDGLTFANGSVTNASLPAPTSNVTKLLAVLKKINLDTTDLVALSGGHTIGLAHCTSFTNRLFPSQDPIMNKYFAKNLYLTCPAANTNNTTVNDVRSPNTFDNKYYVDLLNREGLFTSDQDLYSDQRTKSLVTRFAISQSLFFEQFVYSIVKMGQLSVLTGDQGEIRANCSARNPDTKFLWSVVDDEEGEKLAY